MTVNVNESQVEDALATYPEIFANLIGLEGTVSLLLRQHPLESGRLDLLYAAGRELLLVELKVTSFRQAFLEQVLTYAADLRVLQDQGSLIDAPIRSYLLCPLFLEPQLTQCRSAGVVPVKYSPEDVLRFFFSRLSSIARFVSIKPSDSGLWHIRLIHRVLNSLSKTSVPRELAHGTNLSLKTITNHLRFARDLFLVERTGRNWVLSEMGIRYMASRDHDAPLDAMSEGQRQILREFIVKDPFASPTIFGIYAIVECVFTLARNSYPVDISTLAGFFRDTSGKTGEWLTETSERHGVGMYSNFAIELGLLAKTANQFLLTPDGVRFVLLLQLHKGIAMVDAVGPRGFQ